MHTLLGERPTQTAGALRRRVAFYISPLYMQINYWNCKKTIEEAKQGNVALGQMIV